MSVESGVAGRRAAAGRAAVSEERAVGGVVCSQRAVARCALSQR